VNASAVVAAAQALAKINAAGHWIDRTEAVNLNALFERMTADELQRYAEKGELPEWFQQAIGATVSNREEDKSNG
jgi:S-adenosylmethionine:diacylglycerol 3-amino-3-carboxypropyl transferase